MNEPPLPPEEEAAAREEAAAAQAARDDTDASLLVAIPGLARIAASAWWRTTGWAAETSLRAGSRVFRAAVSGESAADLFQATGAELREQARRILEVGSLEGSSDGVVAHDDGATEGDELRDRGAELLRRSADVDYGEDAHPAYERILEALAPDEARILRLLAIEGPQPSVDVRSGWLPMNAASQLVAPGINMIGAEAGCRYMDRVHAYLNNLSRLGLIWFSREPLEDPLAYQVLEAQPDVVDALREAGRGRTVRRSIQLTPFGRDFCDTCLPLDTVEIEALPGGGVQPAGE